MSTETTEPTTDAPPKTIYCVIDTDTPEGYALWDAVGSVIDGVPVVEETHQQGARFCEHCGERRDDVYVVTHDDGDHGVPVCRDHLENSHWITAVVDTIDELPATVEGSQ